MQNLFVKKGYTREEGEAAIDDMARHQLGFAHKMSALGEHSPSPVYIGGRSIYCDKHSVAFPYQFRWRDGQVRPVCFDESCACHIEKPTLKLVGPLYGSGRFHMMVQFKSLKVKSERQQARSWSAELSTVQKYSVNQELL